jgi:hypothetical protein
VPPTRRELPPGAAVRFLARSVSDAAEDVIGLIRAGARGYVLRKLQMSNRYELSRWAAERRLT